MLNGSTLVNVEVTKTTLGDGTTSYGYVVITKIGETVRTIVVSPSSSPTTSPTTATSDNNTKSSSSLSDPTSTVKSSSALGVGAVVGIIAGAFVLILVLFAFFILQRRRTKDRPSDASSDDIFDPPVVGKQVRLLEQGQVMADTEYADVTRTAVYSRSSGDSIPEGRRHRATLWEDPVILASRIPIDRIELGIIIGHGAFGEVYRGRYRDHDVAVKTLLPEKRKDIAHIKAFLSEVRIMATMEHPNIVPFIGVAWESLSDLFCVTEFMKGGDLRTLLKDYLNHDVPQGMDATKMQIAYEAAFALTYLHSLQPAMLHRDLKSRNILLTESLHAKITDFGASRIRSDATMTSNVGSSLWMAPEVMMSGHYDEKADVFSLGVVISELDTHELPYSHAKDENGSSGRSLPEAAVLQMVSMGTLRVRCSRFMHPEMVHLVGKCVSVNPADRPTAAEVVYCLQTALKNRHY
ncbi:TKL protein kinase [Phytophthora cinnamomi]|uniref:TKL protein kinase n=1 Tax=Phytophthora cinnamomi TaxID=4785 RepID=UPI00355A9A25|nr:TKL protein kinase [Phytophthora cinnamomi]